MVGHLSHDGEILVLACLSRSLAHHSRFGCRGIVILHPLEFWAESEKAAFRYIATKEVDLSLPLRTVDVYPHLRIVGLPRDSSSEKFASSIAIEASFSDRLTRIPVESQILSGPKRPKMSVMHAHSPCYGCYGNKKKGYLRRWQKVCCRPEPCNYNKSSDEYQNHVPGRTKPYMAFPNDSKTNGTILSAVHRTDHLRAGVRFSPCQRTDGNRNNRHRTRTWRCWGTRF